MDHEEIAKVVHEAFDADRVEVTAHFWDELRADAFMLPDVLCAVGEIVKVVEMGQDRAGDPKYELTGAAADGRLLSMICSLKETGAVLFITAYESH